MRSALRRNRSRVVFRERQARESMTRSMPRQKPGGSRQNYETPSEFILPVVRRFGEINFDLAASPHNAKSACYYTKRQNALTRTWIGQGPNRSFTFWLNPPYSYIPPWVRKCDRERHFLTSGQILVLLPASVGSTWFEKYVWRKAAIYFLEGRICFIENEPYPKDLMLLQYRALRYALPISIWDWKNNKLYKQR